MKVMNSNFFFHSNPVIKMQVTFKPLGNVKFQTILHFQVVLLQGFWDEAHHLKPKI